ncbi:MAG: hypothetical protein FWE29_01850, partial [Defluviitaleaceae bacterium]|nr:hypothetical protein [Defluviitaleaceae bacterium]
MQKKFEKLQKSCISLLLVFAILLTSGVFDSIVFAANALTEILTENQSQQNETRYQDLVNNDSISGIYDSSPHDHFEHPMTNHSNFDPVGVGISPFNFDEIPQHIYDILDNPHARFSSLSDSEKDDFLNYMHVRRDTMLALEAYGFNVLQSIAKATIMQKLNISASEVLAMINAHDSIAAAAMESLRLSNYQYTFRFLNGDNAIILANFLILGYTADEALGALIVSQALHLESELVIGSENNQLFRLQMLPLTMYGAEQSLNDDPFESDNTEDEPTESGEYIEYYAPANSGFGPSEEFESEPENNEQDDEDIEPESENNEELESEDQEQDLIISEPEIELIPLISHSLSFEDIDLIAEIADVYHVNAFAIFDYANNNGMSAEDVAIEIAEFRMVNGLIIAMPNSEELHQEWQGHPSAPFTIASGSGENINLNTGSITYESHIISIPGRGGFDLNLSLQYDLNAASMTEMSGQERHGLGVFLFPQIVEQRFAFRNNELIDWETLPGTLNDPRWVVGPGVRSVAEAVGYAENYLLSWLGPNWRDNRSPSSITIRGRNFTNPPNTIHQYFFPERGGPFLEGWGWGITGRENIATTRSQNINPMSFMGAGWSLNFNRILIEGNEKFFRFTNGSTFQINADGSLRNYRLSGVSVHNFTGGNFPGTRYAAFFPDGRREFFDGEGNMVGKQDRFGNSIRFETVNTSGTHTRELRIWDSNSRLTAIRYNPNGAGNVQIILPDNNTITYYFRYHGAYRLLDRKIDQLGNVTNFDYSVTSTNFTFSPTAASERKTNVNLTSVNYPSGASTIFEYSLTNARLGARGRHQIPQISRRFDMSSGRRYNEQTFTYTGSFTGYPNHAGANNLPSGFRYSVTVTNSDGLRSVHTFDSEHMNVLTETTHNSRRISQESIYFNHLNLPVFIESTTFGEGSNSFSVTEEFAYDNFGNITWHRDVRGNTTIFTYDHRFQMPLTRSYVRNWAEVIEENILDSTGRSIIESTVTENGELRRRTQFTRFDASGNVTERRDFIDPTNFITTDISYLNSVLPQAISVDGISTIFARDIMGRLFGTIDANGNETRFFHDARGRVIRQLNHDRTEILFEFDDLNNRLTTTDENGVSTIFSYDALGNITEVRQSGKPYALSRFEYDTNMRLVREFDAYGRQTTYTYDHLGRMTSRILPSALREEIFIYEDAFDSVHSRVTHIIRGDSNAPDIRTAAYQDRFGQNVKNAVFEGQTVHYETNTFDIWGNLISILSARDAAEGRESTQEFGYDIFGRRTMSVDARGLGTWFGYDFLGRQTIIMDGFYNTSRFYYDSQNRLIEEHHPFGWNSYTIRRHQYDANGNLTETAISNSIPGEPLTFTRTTFEYDSRNRLVRVNSFDGDTLESFVEYTYDAVGNMLEMRAANGANITTYEYDSYNRVIRITDALCQSETFTYDRNGNMLTHIDRNGITITNTYDELNRLTNVTAKNPDGTAASEFKRFAYARTGAVILEENEHIKITRTFDSLGRLITETETHSNGIPQTVKTYTYDIAGNRLSFILRQNNQIVLNNTYAYDELNRLIRVYENGSLTVTYTYDIFGNRATKTYPNGNTTTYAYNRANLVTSMTNFRGHEVISQFFYEYYLDGNQRQIIENTGRITTYTYDGLGRLTNEIQYGGGLPNITKVYTFDTAGNRASMTVTGEENFTVTYYYDQNNRLLQEIRIEGDNDPVITFYTYDPNGNQISRTVSGGITDQPATPITEVALSITAPATGNAPSQTAEGTGSFTISNITWSLTGAVFEPNKVYSVWITLNADEGYTFTGLTAATLNGRDATTVYNTGAALIVSYEFPATDPISINSIGISVATPITGNAPSSIVTGLGSFEVSAVTWSPTAEAFAPNTVYTVHVTLTANEGHNFNATPEVTINGNPASIVHNTGAALIVSYAFPATASTAITTAALNVIHPATGDTPNTTAVGAGNFTISPVTWSPSVTNIFAANTIYTATVTLTANEGFTFSGLTSASINGSPAVISNNTGNTVTISYIFPATASIPTENVAIIVTTPITGAVPNTTALGSGSFTLSAVTWSPAANTFAANTRYTATVTLTTTAGHTFTGLTAATINGNAATISNNTGNQVTLSYQFPATVPILITTAAINVTAPVTGATPSTAAFGSGNFSISPVTWSPSANIFAANTRYTATVTLTANAGFTFSGLTTATINDNIATVTNNTGNQATLSYQFPPTLEIPTTPPEDVELRVYIDGQEVYDQSFVALSGFDPALLEWIVIPSDIVVAGHATITADDPDIFYFEQDGLNFWIH